MDNASNECQQCQVSPKADTGQSEQRSDVHRKTSSKVIRIIKMLLDSWYEERMEYELLEPGPEDDAKSKVEYTTKAVFFTGGNNVSLRINSTTMSEKDVHKTLSLRLLDRIINQQPPQPGEDDFENKVKSLINGDITIFKQRVNHMKILLDIKHDGFLTVLEIEADPALLE